MNHIKARVTELKNSDDISVVSFDAFGTTMRMMALGMSMPIEPNAAVVLGVKASHISIAKNLQGELSISNTLWTTVESLKRGELLCSVKLRFHDLLIESIITLDSANEMNLKVGDEVTALIKSSELSIVELG
jgi:molybdopterin-binding protein